MFQDLQDGNDLDEVKGRVVQLSDENGSHTLEESSSVHVDRRADGQDEAADVLGYAVIFLHTLHHQGQSGRAKAQGMCECMSAKGMCVCFCRERKVCVLEQKILSFKIFNNQRGQTSVCAGVREVSSREFIYLELVPKAVARAANIPQRKVYGFFLVMTK